MARDLHVARLVLDLEIRSDAAAKARHELRGVRDGSRLLERPSGLLLPRQRGTATSSSRTTEMTADAAASHAMFDDTNAEMLGNAGNRHMRHPHKMCRQRGARCHKCSVTATFPARDGYERNAARGSA